MLQNFNCISKMKSKTDSGLEATCLISNNNGWLTATASQIVSFSFNTSKTLCNISRTGLSTLFVLMALFALSRERTDVCLCSRQ